ncbi:uncharacterized protein TM35_000221310 [Trypanosoma theileri]|uniref:CHCH domain-containing protein n=1 Tax=Trypanosoma theileri TaxID=67003 RepID=A0A1X0NRK0_9TRYP|nr:uncharacterized protein TM35_000221310 [Trypanosoma theileri]ORC87332.1 hypothetical protein TM35_000221310 [Trypanosoma theileri]
MTSDDSTTTTTVAAAAEATTTTVGVSSDPVDHSERHFRARTHQTNIGDAKKGVAFKEFRRSWLTPFFGANEPEPLLSSGAPHPCKYFSRQVHECLELNNNNVDFCQTKLALFQSCLVEFDL